MINNSKDDAFALCKLIEYCCQKNIPHNLFVTRRSKFDEICIFLFPRHVANFGVDKVYTSHLNVAFCELSGYIPIGDEELFDSIEENYILGRFHQEMGKICDEIENDFIKLINDL